MSSMLLNGNVVFTEARAAQFHAGEESRAQEYLGAHFVVQDGTAGVCFRVWAPRAVSVSVIGCFNDWDRRRGVMTRSAQDPAIWECFLPGPAVFDCYKFSIETADGRILDKADPFAFHAETRPNNASKLYELSGYEWHDAAWLRYRRMQDSHRRPMNIYEMHFGSWKRHEDGAVYSYREMAEQIIPYVKSMGYTHIELLPMTEYPYDPTGGYQPTGWFAATSRYGTPQDLMYFIDSCHRAGVGVIFGWVCAAFPYDEFALAMFDGTPCFEAAADRRIHPWETIPFDYSKPEVRSFLLSSARFWVETFHADGLKVDSVTVLLYQDFGQSTWEPEKAQENPIARQFLQHLNRELHRCFPDVATGAEEATEWPFVTHPVEEGGLGFDYEWDLKWTQLLLSYIQASE
ncbi:MAG: alpha-amylase family glycosyl hydrolase, partial [Butyricicoccaceae bacterium]